MTITETVCSNCEHTIDQPSPPPYCSQCGAEEPWEERAVYTFSAEDLPIVFSYRISDDNWGLWDAFCEQYFGVQGLKGTDTAGLPQHFPLLKYCEVELWYRITTEAELKGPFLSEEKAREA